MLGRLLGHHATLAGVLGLLVTVAGVTWNTNSAAGSDAYGYVSQVELWLRGDLHIDQPFALDVPWPRGPRTFAPLGYWPSPDGGRLVPTYSPGLPLLMAAVKALGGHCLMFWVVPITGGILILATYGIGRRVGRPLVGLAAAWIVATSPAVLFMLMAPMSDVPASAAWAVAVACLLGDTRRGALAAGLAASMAILVRPNLVPLAALLALWAGWRDVATGRWRTWSTLRALSFGAAASIGAIAVAVINVRLNGSPFLSGYGSLSHLFDMTSVLPNVRVYASWFVATQTPLALLGLLSLAVPARLVWRTPQSRQARWVLAGCVVVVWTTYLLYTVFDAWWYLRFLLPSWPAIGIGTASLLAMCYRAPSAWARQITVGVLIGLGAWGINEASGRGAFALVDQEAKYVEAALLVQSVTSPDDVIIAGQHSGSIRYYAGRLTLRWDEMDPKVLDHAVAWLIQNGHHPYFLLDDWEVARVRSRFGMSERTARLNWAPVVSIRGGAVELYDAVRRDQTAQPIALQGRRAGRCLPPQPPPTLRKLETRRGQPAALSAATPPRAQHPSASSGCPEPVEGQDLNLRPPA